LFIERISVSDEAVQKQTRIAEFNSANVSIGEIPTRLSAYFKRHFDPHRAAPGGDWLAIGKACGFRILKGQGQNGLLEQYEPERGLHNPCWSTAKVLKKDHDIWFRAVKD
jgi:hypothetical protein